MTFWAFWNEDWFEILQELKGDGGTSHSEMSDEEQQATA